MIGKEIFYPKKYFDLKGALLIALLMSVFVVLFQAVTQTGYTIILYLIYIFNPVVFLANMLPILLMILLLYFITGKLNLGFNFTMIVLFVLLTVNHYKIIFLDQPLRAGDLMLGKETVGILGNYKLNIDLGIIIMLAVLIFSLVFVTKKIKTSKINPLIRIFGALMCITIMLGLYLGFYSNQKIYQKIGGLKNEFYDVAVYNCRGFVYSFLNGITDTGYPIPENYDENMVKAELKKQNESKNSNENLPDVIAVMSESYFDAQQGSKTEFYKNPYENYNKIKKESDWGTIVVPGFAGSTASTEFEFLTGVNVFLADSSLPAPYNKLVTSSSYSIARFFKENGFMTYGMHPGEAWFYNRENVYKYMGFDNIKFKNSLNGEIPQTNFYANDTVTAKMIKDSYSEHLKNNPDKGYFGFAVTIQNHGPYMNFDTKKDKILKRPSNVSDELYYTMENYFQGISDSDKFIKEIKDFIEEIDKPTVFLFFGDHLPYLDSELIGYESLGIDLKNDGLNSLLIKHSTPYFICSNKAFKDSKNNQGVNVKKGENEPVSSNFLANKLFDYIGADRPDYFKYIDEISKDVSVIFPGYYIVDKEFKTELSEPLKQKLDIMKQMQYYNTKVRMVNKNEKSN